METRKHKKYDKDNKNSTRKYIPTINEMVLVEDTDTSKEHFVNSFLYHIRIIHKKIKSGDTNLHKEYSNIGRLLYNSQAHLDTIIEYNDEIKDVAENLIRNKVVVPDENSRWSLLYIYYKVMAVNDEKRKQKTESQTPSSASASSSVKSEKINPYALDPNLAITAKQIKENAGIHELVPHKSKSKSQSTNTAFTKQMKYLEDSMVQIDNKQHELMKRVQDMNLYSSQLDLAEKERERKKNRERERKEREKEKQEKKVQWLKLFQEAKDYEIKRSEKLEDKETKKMEFDVSLYYSDSNKQLLDYWLNIISIANKREYTVDNLYEYKRYILNMIKYKTSCNEVLSFNKFYKIKEDVKQFESIFCIVFLLIGKLTKVLKDANICTLLIKGGKAIQFSFDIESSDIDIMILPINDKGIHHLSKEKMLEIGKKILDFIIWITSDTPEPFLSAFEIPANEERGVSSHIIKCSIKLPKTGTSSKSFEAVMDLNVSYNEHDSYIKELSQRYLEKRVELEPRDIYVYYYQNLDTIIKEKIYYIILYTLKGNENRNSGLFRARAYISLFKILKMLKLENNKSVLRNYLKDVYNHVGPLYYKDAYRLELYYKQIIEELFYDNDVPKWICGNCSHHPSKYLYTNYEILQKPLYTKIRLHNWTSYITLDQLVRP